MAATKHKPSRTVFLSDPEIRELERMDAGQISAHFMQAGVDKASQIVRAMIASYRITAHVANAAWGLFETLRCHPDILEEIDRRPDLKEALGKVGAALSSYSPGNWPPPRTDREYAMHVLEKLYETATRRPSWESALEAIYQAVEVEYEEVNKP